MNRRHILIVTAGGALAFGCGEKIATTGTPPAPEPATAEGSSPEEVAEPVAEAPPALPTWDEVGSGHPPGATNPPRPELIVTPEGRCYKHWVSPMMRRAPGSVGDHVQACVADECGWEIQCPEPRASEVLAAHQAGVPAPDPNAPK
jgi:hypothetical protein